MTRKEPSNGIRAPVGVKIKFKEPIVITMIHMQFVYLVSVNESAVTRIQTRTDDTMSVAFVAGLLATVFPNDM